MHPENGFTVAIMRLLMINNAWVAKAIAPAGMHIPCDALRYNKPNKP